MKLKITLASILLLVVFSCKKGANNGPIVGKWRSTQLLLMNAISEPLYVQFNASGTVQSTYFTNCTGYSVTGNDLTLKYTGSSISQVDYTYSIKQDTLTLYPTDATTSCVGCSFSFVKE